MLAVFVTTLNNVRLLLVVVSSLVCLSLARKAKPLTNANINDAVTDWCDIASRARAEATFGPINDWDTSRVTVMNNLFLNSPACNPNIAAWDVSGVTNMAYMFENAKSFNQNIALWDVSSVTNMLSMFRGAESFNQNLDAWDVSSVRTMVVMFRDAISFNQNLETWDVSSVQWMKSMFYGAKAFNGKLEAWHVGSVKKMFYMFRDAESFNQDLAAWDVSSVSSMTCMFYGARSFNGKLETWNVSSVTEMNYMFSGAASFNQNLETWDVSSVTTMKGMFNGAESFNQNLETWNVNSVTDMTIMFNSANAFNSRNSGEVLCCSITTHFSWQSSPYCKEQVGYPGVCTKPMASPTKEPTMLPTALPTPPPTVAPTKQPTSQPSKLPTLRPTGIPTSSPTPKPSQQPTAKPTKLPTTRPTVIPTSSPTTKPSQQPIARPTKLPTPSPTGIPTSSPTPERSLQPTAQPSKLPTLRPTGISTSSPTPKPSLQPTKIPTSSPTVMPTPNPTEFPTAFPTSKPTVIPTASPTPHHTAPLTAYPTTRPTVFPTLVPHMMGLTQPPMTAPTVTPSSLPTKTFRGGIAIDQDPVPTLLPTMEPTRAPTKSPTATPASVPTTVLPTTEQPTRSDDLQLQDAIRGTGQVCSGSKDCMSGTCRNGVCMASKDCYPVKHSYGRPFDSNAVNIVFVASAFDTHEAWRDQVNSTYRSFRNLNMFSEDIEQLNIFLVDPSKLSKPFCLLGCATIDRLLCCDVSKAQLLSQKCFPVGTNLQTVVIHNDKKYGGAGYYSQNVATMSTHARGAEVAIHELGHSLFELGDEYSYFGGSNGTVSFPNCDSSSTCDKWSDLIGKEDALRVAGYDNVTCMPGCRNNNYFVGSQSYMSVLNNPVGAVNERFTCCTYQALTKSMPSYCDAFDFSSNHLFDYCKNNDYQKYGTSSYDLNPAIKIPVATQAVDKNYVYVSDPMQVQIKLRRGGKAKVIGKPIPLSPGLFRKSQVIGDFSRLSEAARSGGDSLVKIKVVYRGAKKVLLFSRNTTIDVPLLTEDGKSPPDDVPRTISEKSNVIFFVLDTKGRGVRKVRPQIVDIGVKQR